MLMVDVMVVLRNLSTYQVFYVILAAIYQEFIIISSTILLYEGRNYGMF